MTELEQMAYGWTMGLLIAAFLGACLFWRWYRMYYPRGWRKAERLREERVAAGVRKCHEAFAAYQAKQGAAGFSHFGNLEKDGHENWIEGWRKTCLPCNGTGDGNWPLPPALRTPAPHPCPKCEGRGWIETGLPRQAVTAQA